MEIKLLPNERIDDLHRNGLKIIQNRNVFSFTMDSVLLSGFAGVNNNDRVVDLGTGTGVLPLLIAGRKKVKEIIGLEIQDLLVDMAQRSVYLNKLENIKIIKGDIKEAPMILGAETFDVVVSNPPYMKGHRGEINALTTKAIARHEILCNLEDVISGAAKLVKYGGKIALVHKTERIVDIFNYMRQYNVEPKRLRLVQPKKDKESNIVLIEGIKGAKPGLKTLPTLIIYEETGKYTKEVEDLYNK
jgi:tRNA1Val (adenine37-N6)-methyltransferase